MTLILPIFFRCPGQAGDIFWSPNHHTGVENFWALALGSMVSSGYAATPGLCHTSFIRDLLRKYFQYFIIMKSKKGNTFYFQE